MSFFSKKKSQVQKDLNRRRLVQHYEQKRLALKVIQNNLSLSSEKRFLAFVKLSRLNKNSSKIRLRNRCVLTGRSRGVHKFFRISRIMLRHLAAKGLLPGVKKASW